MLVFLRNISVLFAQPHNKKKHIFAKLPVSLPNRNFARHRNTVSESASFLSQPISI